MKKKLLSKILLPLGTLASVGAIATTLVSCGDKYTHPEAPAKEDRVAGIKVKSDFLLTEDQKKNMGEHRIAVISDGGDIKDKSFNQSTWEAACEFGEQNKIEPKFYDVLHVQNDQFEQNYQTALDKGYKYWVLTGFLHQAKIEQFAKTNKAKLDEKGIVIIAVDFDSSSNNDLKGHFIGLNFRTKEGGFMAGVAAADYLNQQDTLNKTVTSLGGGAFAGVTDFIEGFLKGVLVWNEEHTDKKIKTSEAEFNLATGFNPSAAAMTSAADTSLTTKPGVILPVAGPLTHVVSDHNKTSENGTLIIGVDTDQAITASKNQNQYFTSILKRIGQATYDVLGTLISGKTIEGFELGKTSVNIVKGVNDDWVGLAPTYLKGEAKTKAEKALNDAKAKFAALSATDKEWLTGIKALKTGSDIEDIKTRIKALVTEINK